AKVRRRTVRGARAGPRESRDVGGREVDAVRAPDVAVEPAERVEVLDRRAPVELAAERLFLDGLREMRVQHETEPARELGGRTHQLARDGERRADACVRRARRSEAHTS